MTGTRRRRFPSPNPISEGWFGRGTPIDHVGTARSLEPCPVCQEPTVMDAYRAMLGRHGGLGLPFFLSPFVERSSTRGKWGQRSLWAQCRACRSVLPRDEAAQAVVERFGRPRGFLNAPEDTGPEGLEG